MNRIRIGVALLLLLLTALPGCRRLEDPPANPPDPKLELSTSSRPA